jgi:hypothetical protein
MGVAGWRLAHGKRNLSGRAGFVAVLKDWQVICSGRLDDHALGHALQPFAAVTRRARFLRRPCPSACAALQSRRELSAKQFNCP